MKKFEEDKYTSVGFIVSVTAFTIILFHTIIFNKKHRELLIEHFYDKFFIMNLIAIIIFSVAIFMEYDFAEEQSRTDTARKQGALKHALIGLVISLLAVLDFKLIGFWLVFIISYYLEID